MSSGSRTQGVIHVVEEHLHNVMLCYPTLVAPVLINGGVGAWVVGAKTEVIPAATVNDAFDIHYVVLSSVSAADDYELFLYSGLAGAEVMIADVPFTTSSPVVDSHHLMIITPVVPPGTRISAALASSGGSDSCRIKLGYHTY